MIQNSYPNCKYLQISFFFYLLHEPLGEWKNSKIWETSKIFITIADNLYEIVDTANVAFSLA